MPELVTVLFGGPSAEHDVSILTGLQSERVLSRAGTTVQCIYWARGGQWHLVPAETEARDYLAGAPDKSAPLTVSLGANPGVTVKQGLRTKNLELGTVLNCLHGGAGEGGGAQALFELLGVPSTGGTMAAAALGMDKLAFGAVMTSAGLPSLTREHLGPVPPTFDGPYIVKPRFGGSSIGIEVVPDHATALSLLGVSPHLRSGAVVEPYRTDLFDLNISCRTFPEFATSLIERPLRPGDGIYSFTEKYIQTSGLSNAPREMPAQISNELAARIAELAEGVAQLTGLRGVLRIDFLSDGEQVYVNEVNSIPGAMALYLWPDVDPARILLDAVAEAQRFFGTAATTSFDEGAALRAAGGISGKLASLNRP